MCRAINQVTNDDLTIAHLGDAIGARALKQAAVDGILDIGTTGC